MTNDESPVQAKIRLNEEADTLRRAQAYPKLVEALKVYAYSFYDEQAVDWNGNPALEALRAAGELE